MSLIDQLIGFFAPHDCVGCGAEGSLMCGDCLDALDSIPDRCYRCRRLSTGAITCSGCRKTSRLRVVRSATIYKDEAKELVWRLKFSGAQAAVRPMARHMLHLMPVNKKLIIVPVPTSTKRVRRRGYDQASLLAKELAKLSGESYLPCLRRKNQTHQVGARRSQRVAQMRDAFRVTKIDIVKGAYIVLIDDVLTTGSTLESAAMVLKRAGAKQVDALVFAQP